MTDHKLKWIGWYKMDYFAWINPDGMIYRFDDLPRNEAGKKYEKEERKLKLNDDLPVLPLTMDVDFFEWELDLLKQCAFCHDRKSLDIPDGEEKEHEGGGVNVAAPGWEQYASGNVTYTGDTTSTGDTTYTGDTAYNTPPGDNAYGKPPGYGSSSEGKDHIPSLPYLPPKQLPAQPTPQQPPTARPPTTRPRTPKPNPVLNTRKVVENKAVTSTPFKQPQEESPTLEQNVPFERRKFRYLVQPDEEFSIGNNFNNQLATFPFRTLIYKAFFPKFQPIIPIHRQPVSSKRQLPKFEILENNYPKPVWNIETEKMAPAHPSRDGYENQCAIRMGKTLRDAGVMLNNYTDPVTSENYPRGAKSLADWLERNYSKPKKMTQQEFEEKYWNKKGIIFLKKPDSESADHIDLWNKGDRTIHSYYLASEVWFWEL